MNAGLLPSLRIPESSGRGAVFDFSEPPSGKFWVQREVKIGDTRIDYGVQAASEGGGAKIYSVRTPQPKRGHGSARRALEAFLRAADQARIPVTLDASPLDGRTKLYRLVAFYESMGFECTGRTINPAGDPEMRRAVQPCAPSRRVCVL